jgi:hypothetical protein
MSKVTPMSVIERQGEIEGFAMHVLEEEIGEVFVTVHQYFDTSSGDITPEQTVRLDKLVEQLACLIREQVMQNNPKYTGTTP